MSLRMSKQAIIELLNSNAVKYRKTRSRKAKGELLKQLMVAVPLSTGEKYPGEFFRVKSSHVHGAVLSPNENKRFSYFCFAL